jgi:hypothetical protein
VSADKTSPSNKGNSGTGEHSVATTGADLKIAVNDMRPDDRAAIYEHVAKVTELFMEWRHKVMAFTFTVTSGLLAISAWMYDRDLKRAIVAPLALGALLALASAVFDGRNQRILYGCYELADALEQKLGLPPALGPFGRIPIGKDAPRWKRLNTYHGVLKFAYSFLFVLLAAAAVYVLLSPPSPR